MDPWQVFCGEKACICIGHILIISANVLLLLFLAYLHSRKLSSRKNVVSSASNSSRLLLVCCCSLNGGLGAGYFCLAVWKVVENSSVLPLHSWLVLVLQGFTMLFLGLSVSKKQQTTLISSVVKVCFLEALVVGFLCFLSIWELILNKVVYVESVLNVLSLPGMVLLLICAYKEQRVSDDCYYEALEEQQNVTGFAKAGFLSKMAFCWLSPVLKKGKERTLGDRDIPELRPDDRAGTLHCLFKEQMNRQKQANNHPSCRRGSVFWSIVASQRRGVLVSGAFALVKILTVSTGPIFLYEFIEVANGRGAFEYEGYALTAGILLAKCLESLAERQWFFRTRLIGLQVRSLLTAAIYEKQLSLSSTTKTTHLPGEIMNYATVDAYKIGEFPFWFHQIWTTGIQICFGLGTMYYAVGLATIPAVVLVVLSVLVNSPVAKLQHKYLTELMVTQDRMLRAITEALTSMKVLKLYAWEMHFKNGIERLREEEFKWLKLVQVQKGYYMVLFWSSPIIVSAVTFWACYVLRIPLNASNVFTFLATFRIIQEPIRSVPDVLGVFIEAKVSFTRILKFLEAPELQHKRHNENKYRDDQEPDYSVLVECNRISWQDCPGTATLQGITLCVKPGQKVAICGEVGSGKSTLIAAILGEVPFLDGTVQVHGKLTYVSQNAWIQTGTIQENILFGSIMDQLKYDEVIKRSSLEKDLQRLPFGDQTVIGERGVNLSGGQKQRVQLARALYQDADIYLLDDPFSAVDAHTATSLFNEYVMGALSRKTVLLVTHQVDFLPAFDSILLMSEGKILKADTYDQLLISCQEFHSLVCAHRETAKSETNGGYSTRKKPINREEESIQNMISEDEQIESTGEQLIKQEERETGNTGLKPYKQYLGESHGFFYLLVAIIAHLAYMVGQLEQNLWLAADLQNPEMSKFNLILIYSAIGFGMSLTLFLRSYAIISLGLRRSKSIFAKLMASLIRAPMSFYDSTPLGRILSRVSLDLSVVDLDLSFRFSQAVSVTLTTYFSLGALAALTWPILIVIIPTVYVTILLQRFYFATAKELMRIDGTTKSSVASHLAESVAGATTIRAFGEEERFCSQHMHLIDKNASSTFHSFSATEWLIQRLEMICAVVLSSSALAMTLLPFEASKSGYIGMALSYALSLNVSLVYAVQNQCMLENSIVSVERLEQYMNIPSEAPEIIEGNRPAPEWPSIGKVEIHDLKI
ncbi:PREDICTED: ABC transporter C family member 10-like isoform X2 [Ipomoea nil]|uniref:ABC transporter C family member 10-like isoform X2 n=1 Tax=Ipomoea nil TaxID=35883 RepID=UPI000901A7DE|nr:PREDICTED: ABC transporter C family member 10-like isoform X2 [Ipomoea nil]